MSAVDVFVLGYCEDTRVLLDLLMTEAPAMRSRLVIVEPDQATARELTGRGFSVRRTSLTDPVALETLIAGARVVACFAPERFGWPPDVLEAFLRSFVPDASLYIHGATSTLPHRANRAPLVPVPSGLGARLGSWRLWFLVALTAVDAAVFFLPVTSAALLAAALVAPRRLQQAASFLDTLATGREG
jgi:hypothetical protein